MNFVKVISTELDTINRRIVKLLRFGKSDVQTSLEAMPFGIDSNPIKDLVAVYSATEEKGKTVIIGYVNRNQLAGIGETRLFSTDGNGVLKTYIHLKNDGTQEIGGNADNLVRYSVLKSEYDKTKDALDAIMSVLTGAPINEPGSGSPSALQAALLAALTGKSTGDITGAKIEQIKTI
jgi:hypothetical protein